MAKAHSFEFSGKALAGLSAALTAGGMLMFSLGLLVGLSMNGTSLTGALRKSDTATTATTPTHTLAAATSDPAAWPFGGAVGAPGASAPTTAPSTGTAPVDSAADPATIDSPAKPSAPSTPPKSRASNGLTTVAYVEPVHVEDEPAPENGRYVIQVGMFRNERNAAALVNRLEARGYHPTVIERDEAGRALHIVRVAKIVGLARAKRAAEAIGDAERLVAAVVIDRGN